MECLCLFDDPSMNRMSVAICSILAAKVSSSEDLRLSGSIIRKSRFIFTKELRIIRQKSSCLSHSNERIFQVNIQMQGRIKDSWKGVSYANKILVLLCGFYHLS